jgi:hypothetical protein
MKKFKVNFMGISPTEIEPKLNRMEIIKEETDNEKFVRFGLGPLVISEIITVIITHSDDICDLIKKALEWYRKLNEEEKKELPFTIEVKCPDGASVKFEGGIEPEKAIRLSKEFLEMCKKEEIDVNIRKGHLFQI